MTLAGRPDARAEVNAGNVSYLRRAREKRTAALQEERRAQTARASAANAERFQRALNTLCAQTGGTPQEQRRRHNYIRVLALRLARRDWSYTDLAHQAGMSRSAYVSATRAAVEYAEQQPA